MVQKLDVGTFKTVVSSTPLISMDFVVKNAQGQILLGRRNNRPAQGFWFVPGGRILKDETFLQAFSRLTLNELGLSLSISQARFIGPFEHFYQDNFTGSNFSTHYVVMGYQLVLDLKIDNLPVEQHQDYRWWDGIELLDSDKVHPNTKAYFSDTYK